MQHYALYTTDVLFPGNLDRTDMKFFQVLTMTPMGGVPLGGLIVSREDKPTVLAGFKLLQSIFPEYAFFGKGKMGPTIGITDDCQILREALKTVFPSIILLLCQFHSLQNVNKKV